MMPKHAGAKSVATKRDAQRYAGVGARAVEPGRAVRSRGMGREERRDQLLRLAEKILARGGITALTMESLAVEAKISKPIVYAHFRNRSELLVALFESYWSFVDALITVRRSGTTDPEQFLTRTVEAYLDAMEQRGHALRQLLFKVLEDPVVEAARRSRDQWRGEVALDVSCGDDARTAGSNRDIPARLRWQTPYGGRAFRHDGSRHAGGKSLTFSA
jgi:AcrR family transcriptional regulator